MVSSLIILKAHPLSIIVSPALESIHKNNTHSWRVLQELNIFLCKIQSNMKRACSGSDSYPLATLGKLAITVDDELHSLLTGLVLKRKKIMRRKIMNSSKNLGTENSNRMRIFVLMVKYHLFLIILIREMVPALHERHMTYITH